MLSLVVLELALKTVVLWNIDIDGMVSMRKDMQDLVFLKGKNDKSLVGGLPGE